MGPSPRFPGLNDVLGQRKIGGDTDPTPINNRVEFYHPQPPYKRLRGESPPDLESDRPRSHPTLDRLRRLRNPLFTRRASEKSET